ncbi:ATP-binding protein [Agromyces sp. NPDC004153]
MTPVSGQIRTPDQRLRVFVSSTLKELAPERRAVRAAIEGLRLAPVMFELGARPHPPRDLYRAYLEQSDTFIGLYGAQYGWVAPGEDVSGLEDEYRLSSPGMPKLVYLKEGVVREPRLDALLDHIRDDDGAAYAYYADPQQLAELVRGDLATLLAERFAGTAPAERTDGGAGIEPDGARAPLPTALNPLVGRERELAALVDLLDDGARLITLTGPGGIGKTRLALAAADRVRDRFPGGVVFADLAPVTDPAVVPAAIADALGIVVDSSGRVEEQLRTALRDRHILLLLDNLEQVVDSAPAIALMLADAPMATALVTSRVLLRVSGEHGVELGPLDVPDLDDNPAVAAVAANPAVELFVERVRAAKPDFRLLSENLDDVRRICVALDGVPLAIELAAARARVLAPHELLERLHHRLPVLAGGARDLPERQRTMRATIEWSAHLLEPTARELLTRLGVFAGLFSLDAVEAIADGIEGVDPLADLGALVDGSLVHQEERGERVVFTMLVTVREFAQEELDAGPDAFALRDRHARWFADLAARAGPGVEGAAQVECMRRLVDDLENLRAAIRYLLDTRQWDVVADVARWLYAFWWLRGHLAEVGTWMEEVLASGDRVGDHARAIALYFTRTIVFWQDPTAPMPGLDEAMAIFRAEHDQVGEALCLGFIAFELIAVPDADLDRADEMLSTGIRLLRDADRPWAESMLTIVATRVAILRQDIDAAAELARRILELARRTGDGFALQNGLYHRGWCELIRGDVAAAAADFDGAFGTAIRLEHDEGLAYALEALTAVAAYAGDAERAGTLLGAAEVFRERTGLTNAPTFYLPYVEAIRSGPNAEAFEAARSRGRELTTLDAVERQRAEWGPLA